MREQEIVQLLREHQEQGVTELLRRYRPLMRYVIAPILPNAQDQEECLSEISLRIWEKVGQFDPERGTWTAWLTALARNAALNRARRDRRSGPAEPISEEQSSRDPAPEEIVLRRERKAALEKALGRLPQGERSLFYRKYYYRQSTAQIAAELGMTERAVEGRLYRVKKSLRKLLGGDGFEYR